MDMTSGDLCSFGREPMPAYFITHYRCDDYRDGTITDARTGDVVKDAHYSSPRGFRRTGELAS